MARIKKLEEKVRTMLERYPVTRDDDRKLALAVWCEFYGLDPYTPVRDVLRNEKLPSQESIGRARRKIQEVDETLRGTKYKEKVRMNAQIEFIEYAKGAN